MTIIEEKVTWMELTHPLSVFTSKLSGPFLWIYVYFKIPNSLSKCPHTRENQYLSHMYTIVCTLMPWIIPLITLTLIRTQYEESNPRCTKDLTTSSNMNKQTTPQSTKNATGRTSVSSQQTNKCALPIAITKSGEVQFPIRFLHTFHRRIANATRGLLCEHEKQNEQHLRALSLPACLPA